MPQSAEPRDPSVIDEGWVENGPIFGEIFLSDEEFFESLADQPDAVVEEWYEADDKA